MELDGRGMVLCEDLILGAGTCFAAKKSRIDRFPAISRYKTRRKVVMLNPVYLEVLPSIELYQKRELLPRSRVEARGFASVTCVLEYIFISQNWFRGA